MIYLKLIHQAHRETLLKPIELNKYFQMKASLELHFSLLEAKLILRGLSLTSSMPPDD